MTQRPTRRNNTRARRSRCNWQAYKSTLTPKLIVPDVSPAKKILFAPPLRTWAYWGEAPARYCRGTGEVLARHR